MSFSEEWHEARLRRINRDKLIAIEKTLSQDVVCNMIHEVTVILVTLLFCRLNDGDGVISGRILMLCQ